MEKKLLKDVKIEISKTVEKIETLKIQIERTETNIKNIKESGKTEEGALALATMEARLAKQKENRRKAMSQFLSKKSEEKFISRALRGEFDSLDKSRKMAQETLVKIPELNRQMQQGGAETLRAAYAKRRIFDEIIYPLRARAYEINEVLEKLRINGTRYRSRAGDAYLLEKEKEAVLAEIKKYEEEYTAACQEIENLNISITGQKNKMFTTKQKWFK